MISSVLTYFTCSTVFKKFKYKILSVQAGKFGGSSKNSIAIVYSLIGGKICLVIKYVEDMSLE